MTAAEHAPEFVTFRELVRMLDDRDVRITAQVFDIARRVEHLDEHGSRGLQLASDRLSRVATELEQHAREHRDTIRTGVSNRQWLVTTLIATAGLLAALWDKFPT